MTLIARLCVIERSVGYVGSRVTHQQNMFYLPRAGLTPHPTPPRRAFLNLQLALHSALTLMLEMFVACSISIKASGGGGHVLPDLLMTLKLRRGEEPFTPPPPWLQKGSEWKQRWLLCNKVGHLPALAAAPIHRLDFWLQAPCWPSPPRLAHAEPKASWRRGADMQSKTTKKKSLCNYQTHVCNKNDVTKVKSQMQRKV